MCGRFTLRSGPEAIAGAFDLDPASLPELTPRYNIAPTDPVAVVRRAEGTGPRELVTARWGLVPHWVDDPSDWPTLINARSETAADKPAFRDAFRARRCLVPADGFYEWVKIDGRKQPYHIRLDEDRPFAFAGLWDRWEGGDGRSFDSCTILTTDANEKVAPLQDRMPVLLPPEAYERWTDPAAWPDDFSDLLVPWPDVDGMVTYPVDRRMNSPSHDAPDCIEPLTG